MVVILVHIGTPLPAHIKDCIKQLLLWGNTEIKVVSECENWKELTDINEVDFIPLEEFERDKKIVEYNALQFFRPKGVLWDTSCKRLFYLEAAMKDLNLQSAWHIENDNLVYCNLTDEALGWKFYERHVIYTPVTPKEDSAGILLINNILALEMMTEKILLLMQMGMEGVKRAYDSTFVGEMRLLNILAEYIMPNNVFYFPILNKDCSCTLFDCAS
jgi:hypothetical protein